MKKKKPETQKEAETCPWSHRVPCGAMNQSATSLPLRGLGSPLEQRLPPRSGHMDGRKQEQSERAQGGLLEAWSWTLKIKRDSRVEYPKQGTAGAKAWVGSEGHGEMGQRHSCAWGTSADCKTLPKCSDCASTENPDLTSYLMPMPFTGIISPLGSGRGERTEGVASDQPEFLA